MGFIPERILLNDQIFLKFRSRPVSGKAVIAADYWVKASSERAAAKKMRGSMRSRLENTPKMGTPSVSQRRGLIWIPAAGCEGGQQWKK